jgi:small-conductance mechanosensitive channel
MQLPQQIFTLMWPTASIVVLGLAFAWLINWFFKRKPDGTEGLLYPLLTWLNGFVAVIAIVILLPISDETRGQILSLLGVVLTAVIALSSTTFVSNAMAGLMLQATKPFRPGDYIRVNDQFGRVTRRSLVYTQIQTEWRDLTTLPNMVLVTNAVNVLHREGTIISAEVSIGYDVTYTRVEELMLQAGADAGLEEPFVLVNELLDHAVSYRVCGFLPSIDNLLSARSNLRKTILEQMHGNGIEIVSPSFMNQRQLDPMKKIIPELPVMREGHKPGQNSSAPEAKIFDKAVEAASIEELKLNLEKTREDLKQAREDLKAAAEGEQEQRQHAVAALEQREQWFTRLVKENESGA